MAITNKTYMSQRPNKLSRFWQELKRRRVVHVITVYASSSFVLIELINNLGEPLNLPPNLLLIVVIILAVGFPLAIIISWLYDLTSKGFEKTKQLTEIGDEEIMVVPNAWKIATFISFVVIIGLVTLNISARRDLVKPGSIQAIVVLPFDNFTGDEGLDFFVQGMHTSLIGELGKISGLRVIGKITSSTFKNSNLSIQEIAKRCSVQAAVEGAVLGLGDSIDINIKLIVASHREKPIWIADYTESRSHILNLYNRIAKQIANEIKVNLTPEEEQILGRSNSIDRDVYNAYLRSHQYWDDLSYTSLTSALEYLTMAVEKDPDWAPLYAGLSKVWAGLAQFGYVSPDSAFPKIHEYAHKANELDPDLLLSHFSLASVYWEEWNWEKSEQEFLKAISINPSDAVVRIFYAHVLTILQRTKEAVKQGQLAVDLDPLNPLILSLNAVVIASNGDWKAARALLEKALSIDPEFYFANNLMEFVAYHCGDYDQVFESVKNYQPFEDSAIKDFKRTLIEKGFAQAYEKMLDQMELMAQHNPNISADMPYRYGLLNQFDKAMAWIDTLYEIHDPNLPYFVTGYAHLDSLYDNPRFIEIVEKMHLSIKNTNGD